MSEDSIFIVKDDHILLCSKRKGHRKKTCYIVHYSCTQVLGGEEKKKSSFNLVRPDECFSP